MSAPEEKYAAVTLAYRELIEINSLCEHILEFKLVPIIYENCKPTIALTKVDDPTTLRFSGKLLTLALIKSIMVKLPQRHLVRSCFHYLSDLVCTRQVKNK